MRSVKKLGATLLIFLTLLSALAAKAQSTEASCPITSKSPITDEARKTCSDPNWFNTVTNLKKDIKALKLTTDVSANEQAFQSTSRMLYLHRMKDPTFRVMMLSRGLEISPQKYRSSIDAAKKRCEGKRGAEVIARDFTEDLLSVENSSIDPQKALGGKRPLLARLKIAYLEAQRLKYLLSQLPKSESEQRQKINEALTELMLNFPQLKMTQSGFDMNSIANRLKVAAGYVKPSDLAQSGGRSHPHLAKILNLGPGHPIEIGTKAKQANHYEKIYDAILAGKAEDPTIDRMISEATARLMSEGIDMIGKVCEASACQLASYDTELTGQLIDMAPTSARPPLLTQLCSCAELQKPGETSRFWIKTMSAISAAAGATAFVAPETAPVAVPVAVVAEAAAVNLETVDMMAAGSDLKIRENEARAQSVGVAPTNEFTGTLIDYHDKLQEISERKQGVVSHAILNLLNRAPIRSSAKHIERSAAWTPRSLPRILDPIRKIRPSQVQHYDPKLVNRVSELEEKRKSLDSSITELRAQNSSSIKIRVMQAQLDQIDRNLVPMRHRLAHGQVNTALSRTAQETGSIILVTPTSPKAIEQLSQGATGKIMEVKAKSAPEGSVIEGLVPLQQKVSKAADLGDDAVTKYQDELQSLLEEKRVKAVPFQQEGQTAVIRNGTVELTPTVRPDDEVVQIIVDSGGRPLASDVDLLAIGVPRGIGQNQAQSTPGIGIVTPQEVTTINKINQHYNDIGGTQNSQRKIVLHGADNRNPKSFRVPDFPITAYMPDGSATLIQKGPNSDPNRYLREFFEHNGDRFDLEPNANWNWGKTR